LTLLQHLLHVAEIGPANSLYVSAESFSAT